MTPICKDIASKVENLAIIFIGIVRFVRIPWNIFPAVVKVDILKIKFKRQPLNREI